MNRIVSALALVLLLTAQTVFAAEIWVAPGGSDRNAGSKEQPVASLAAALRKAREMRRLNDPAIEGGIRILMRGGNYALYEPVFVRPEDSGTKDSPTTIEAAPGETPVLSGGFEISNWKPVLADVPGLPREGRGKVWVADVPLIGGRMPEFRQLWVNNRKAVRARHVNAPEMHRILSWNHQTETCWIPLPKNSDIRNAEGLEMLIHQWWAIAVLRVKDVEVRGDSAKLSFHQPESKIQSEHPWPAPWISKETGNSAFFLMNAIQFVDQPGEWFLDSRNRKLYYWPRAGEKMASARVTAPSLETLVRMEGTIDKPVSHVYFKGLSFQHTGWLRPSQAGHVPLQAGMYLLDAYKLKVPGTPEKKGLENQGWVGRPAAAVQASYTSSTGFEACRFEHLASTGLDYVRGAHNDLIEGNLFRDIGGNGILAGVFSDEAFESHLAYQVTDMREVCTNTTIRNNVVTDVTNEDWGCVGIGAGFVKGITIANNDVSEVSYTGISLGWGWTPAINVMSNNRILANRITRYGKHMYDVAAIYTLSAQPGSLIAENSIDSIYKASYVHDPHHWFYLYTDEGSSFFTVRDNWCPSDKFLQNANGPGNVWENNGAMVADSIRLRAGVQKNFQYLLKEKAPLSALPINYVSYDVNTDPPLIIELIGKAGSTPDKEKVKDICRRNAIPSSSVYQWENRVIILGHVKEPEKIAKRLEGMFEGSVARVYKDAFYAFNRKQNCGNEGLVKEWDNIVLSANLVADASLQKEYMDYHASQPQKWPEVAKGFCNADFQQLLMFRNGRQLMLVISIPKGQDLDKLNPRTVENNPRVDEWNALMKKYQEGIEGTRPGEVWVQFEK